MVDIKNICICSKNTVFIIVVCYNVIVLMIHYQHELTRTNHIIILSRKNHIKKTFSKNIKKVVDNHIIV